MSVYSVKGKGWRYDFTLKGTRHTGSWFKTKSEARQAEAKRKEELENPAPVPEIVTPLVETPTAMAFLELVNRRLDHVNAYNSERHYSDHVYLARRWVKEWDGLSCAEVTQDRIQAYLLKRVRVSAFTANKDLRCLRALFNQGMSRNWVPNNPTKGIPFFPVEKRLKYVPPKEDVLRVIATADSDTQDYLWTIKDPWPGWARSTV